VILNYQHTAAVGEFLKMPRVCRTRTDLDGLSQLVQAFLRFPYENFTKIIRASKELELTQKLRLPETVWSEHVELGAGGTCFSLTYFFESVLRFAGFVCYPVMVDRSYGENTHCALIVLLDGGKYLVDPGYLLSRPIRLGDIDETHHLPHNTFIVSPRGANRYVVATNQNGLVKPRYLLKDVPVSPEEFLKHWEASFDWPMMRQLCATKLDDSGYLFLRNETLRHTSSAGKKQQKIIESYDRQVAKTFNIAPEIIREASELIL